MRSNSNTIRTRSRAFWVGMHGARTVRRLSALVLVVLIVGVVPVLAATVDIAIPLETVVYGEAGSQHVLDVVNVPAESRGEVCRVTATARNQDSEHPDSNLTISSATDVEILNVEFTANGTVFGGGDITLSDTVTVILTLGADQVFSAGLDLDIDCPPFNPTTTPTTLEATTAPEATPPTDTSTGGADGEGEASSASTATSAVLGTSITAPGATVAGTSETLPFTGLADGSMGGVAFALVALGGLMVLSVRRRETDVAVAREWQPRIDFYDVNF